MAKHALRFSRAAIKEAEKLPNQVAARVALAIDRLAEDQRPIGSRKLQNEEDLWRLRVGDYRIIYEINGVERIVYIRRIRHRREVYRDI